MTQLYIFGWLHCLASDLSSSLSLGFQLSQFDREALKVVSLLSILCDQHVVQGRRGNRFWFLAILRGFSYSSFFHLLSIPSSSHLVIFCVVWLVLHGEVNTLDRVLSASPLVLFVQWCILCRHQAGDLFHLLSSLPSLFGIVGLLCLVYVWLGIEIV